MKAKFLGVPGEDIDPIEMYGQTFRKGEWTNVPAGFAARKLQNHPHFETKFDQSEIAEDAKIKGEFDKLVGAQVAQAEQAQAVDKAAADEQAKINAKADEAADEFKDEDGIESALEYQKSEDASAAVNAPLTEAPDSALAFQVREEAGQLPGVIEPEETKRGPGRPKKS